MTRFSSRLSALLLASFALAGCSMMGLGDLSSEKKDKDIAAAVKDKAPSPQAVAADMDGNLRQATLLRQAGDYDAAIRILSQLMLGDPDNPRVVAEYGKALAQKGRAQDATRFLHRAIELSSNDWTLYSALGMSYDQLGDQANARLAYEHALALKPGEAGVLNNYAMSRMLAKDPDGARLLIAQAQAAGGANPMIARMIALIADMAPEKAAADAAGKAHSHRQRGEERAGGRHAVRTQACDEDRVRRTRAQTHADEARPGPGQSCRLGAAPMPISPPIPVTPMPQTAAQAPQTSSDLLPSSGQPESGGDGDRRAAFAGAADGGPTEVAAQAPIVPSGVVMQAVPYDPYAGPVVKLKKPQPKVAAKSAPKADTAKADAAKTAADAPKTDKASASKTDAKANVPQKAAATKSDVVPSLRVAADKY